MVHCVYWNVNWNSLQGRESTASCPWKKKSFRNKMKFLLEDYGKTDCLWFKTQLRNPDWRERLTVRVLDFVKIPSLYETLPEIFWTILYHCEENITKLSYSFLGDPWIHKLEKRTDFDFNVSCFKMDIFEQLFLKVFNILKFSSCCIDLINRSCKRF